MEPFVCTVLLPDFVDMDVGPRCGKPAVKRLPEPLDFPVCAEHAEMVDRRRQEWTMSSTAITEHGFVAAVEQALRRHDDQAEQDETDFVLLGGTIERKTVANANCSDCFGAGWVCSCHAIPLSVCGMRPIEHCGCVRAVVTALDGSRFAEALGADIVEPVEDAVTRGAIPHDPREYGSDPSPERHK